MVSYWNPKMPSPEAWTAFSQCGASPKWLGGAYDAGVVVEHVEAPVSENSLHLRDARAHARLVVHI